MLSILVLYLTYILVCKKNVNYISEYRHSKCCLFYYIYMHILYIRTEQNSHVQVHLNKNHSHLASDQYTNYSTEKNSHVQVHLN